METQVPSFFLSIGPFWVLSRTLVINHLIHLMNLSGLLLVQNLSMTWQHVLEMLRKALAHHASIIENYKQRSDHGNNFDIFVHDFLHKTEERLCAEILNERNETGYLPDARSIDEKIERERQHILESIDYPPAQEAELGLLEIVAERIRNMTW